MGPPDTGLFRAINQWPKSLEPIMRFFSEAMNYPAVKVVLAVLLVGLLWANARTRKTAVQAVIAVLLANGLTDFFKFAAPEHRPFQELTDVLMRVGTSASHGTASAHAANMAAVAFVFVYFLGWWGAPWVAIAIITGISRIYCGAHYPHQVLLGWICGCVAGFCVTKGWNLIQSFRANWEPEDVPTPVSKGPTKPGPKKTPAKKRRAKR